MDAVQRQTVNRINHNRQLKLFLDPDITPLEKPNVASAITGLSARISAAFGSGRATAQAGWVESIRAAVCDGVDPNPTDLERFSGPLGIPTESIGDEFTSDCQAFDRVARLDAGSAAAEREYAAGVKKAGTPDALRSKANRLRDEADKLDQEANTLEGLKIAAETERRQAWVLRMKHPRVWGSEKPA